MTSAPIRRETRRTPFAAVLVALSALAAALAGGAWPARAGDAVHVAGGAAIGGYDPVAYFAEGKPVAGSDSHTFAWRGATWRFASAAHRDAFAAAPDRYAPQYGGYCAWAVSQGYTAKIDPEAWRIEGGRLFLNYSKSVQARWAQDIPGNVAKADANWPRLTADLANK